jgi:hypothetical protein
MQPDGKEMNEARGLLAKFEAEMHKPEGVVHLSEALSLLADIRDGGESDKVVEIASNIALAYARKIQREIENLAREPIVHLEIVEHWHKVLQEFDHAGFPLPPEMEAARFTLLLKKMSPSERQYFLEKLQAMGGNSASDHE